MNCNTEDADFSPDYIMKQQMPWQANEEELIVQNQYQKMSSNINFNSELRTIQYQTQIEKDVKRKIRQIQREKGIRNMSPHSDDLLSPKKVRVASSPSPTKRNIDDQILKRDSCLEINLFDAAEDHDYKYGSPSKKPLQRGSMADPEYRPFEQYESKEPHY